MRRRPLQSSAPLEWKLSYTPGDLLSAYSSRDVFRLAHGCDFLRARLQTNAKLTAFLKAYGLHADHRFRIPAVSGDLRPFNDQRPAGLELHAAETQTVLSHVVAANQQDNFNVEPNKGKFRENAHAPHAAQLRRSSLSPGILARP
eukprot:3706556-Pleurochrysis_carterae.AAC.1